MRGRVQSESQFLETEDGRPDPQKIDQQSFRRRISIKKNRAYQDNEDTNNLSLDRLNCFTKIIVVNKRHE